MLGPYLKRAVAEGDDAAKFVDLDILRWLDPAALLEQVQKTRFEREATADYLRGQAALGLAADDPDEAAAIAETIADPPIGPVRWSTWPSRRRPPTAPASSPCSTAPRSRPRSAALSSNKLFQMGEVAERWLELGETDKARRSVRRGPQAGGERCRPRSGPTPARSWPTWRGSSRPRPSA